MTTSTDKRICSICSSMNMIYICPACSKDFCFNHLSQHRLDIQQQYDRLQDIYNQFRQEIHDFEIDPTKHCLIKEIDQWERDSIDRIQQIARQCKTKWIYYSNRFHRSMKTKLDRLAEQIKDIQREKELNEFSLNDLKQRLETLQKQFIQPTNVSIIKQSTSFIKQISLLLQSEKNTRWKQFATTIAGGNGRGCRLNQLNDPEGICVDDENHVIYIADYHNHRIVEWTFDGNNTRIVAGGNGQGNRLDQLNQPLDVIIDRQNDQLIIADCGNRRVMRCSRHSNSTSQILTSDIDCYCLAMHEDGTLYVSDWKKNEVRRWNKGETYGRIVAGGNGQGNQFNQLNSPLYIFVDDDHSLYISDCDNHRVMKWMRDANEGIVVAGGNGKGDQLTQLSSPQGVIVDRVGQIYVADFNNHRVMRWCEGEKQGTIVIGEKGCGNEKNQLNYPAGLSFDEEENLYVVDWGNDRIEKFEIDLD